MKKLLILTSLIISGSLWAEMKPLIEFLSNADADEPTSYLYISKRCSALYATSAGLLSGEIRKEYFMSSYELTKSATELDMKISGLELLVSAAAVQEDIKKFVEIYDTDSEQSYIESGLKLSPLINKDLLTCNAIYKSD